MTIRTRFAPSPTGYLHIGGARTALFSWLYARAQGGKFVLRIEDTDRERSTAESVDAIIEGLAWLGIDWDEGPHFQSQRDDLYRGRINDLLEAGQAYHCYCTREELDARREEQRANNEKPRYDGRCRDRSEPREGVDPVIRFRNPTEGAVEWADAVKGAIRIANSELDDLIIARSDGSPTYNFVVVVDDVDMALTHVIRGDDHVNNTPRQINLMRALGHEPPVYAHVPMILGGDGKRLSKRHGAVSVLQYRDDGYLPEALLNYLVRLGWSHGDQEVFRIDDLKTNFNLDSVQKAPASFNAEKLDWLNQHYLKTLPPEVIGQRLRSFLEARGLNPEDGPDPARLVPALRERAKTLIEMAERSEMFYQRPEAYDEKAARKNLTADSAPVLADIVSALESLGDWTAEPIHEVVHAVAASRELKLGKVAQPIRVAVSGTTVSPPIDETLELLGRDETLQRLKMALNFIDGLSA